MRAKQESSGFCLLRGQGCPERSLPGCWLQEVITFRCVLEDGASMMGLVYLQEEEETRVHSLSGEDTV